MQGFGIKVIASLDNNFAIHSYKKKEIQLSAQIHLQKKKYKDRHTHF